MLPYIALSLITGLGRLTYQQVKDAGAESRCRARALLGAGSGGDSRHATGLSGLGVGILLQYLAHRQPEEINFLTLFIPANPFNSFANNVVPAVVVFSVAVGLALIGIEQKQGLLTPHRSSTGRWRR